MAGTSYEVDWSSRWRPSSASRSTRSFHPTGTPSLSPTGWSGA